MAWPLDANRMPGNIDAGTGIPEIYSAKVINHVRNNLISIAVCDITWKEQLAKGDKLWIPIATPVSSSDVDPHVSFLDTADDKDFLTTGTSITITKWEENPVMIDDSTAQQTSISGLLEKFADNAAYGLMLSMDHTVHELFDDCTDTWIGSDGQTFTDDLFIELQEGLDEASVPRANRSLVCDPSTVADIYKIDKFMSMDYSNKPFTTDAYVGTIPAYNVPVFVTNELKDATTGHYGILLHKEAIGVIIQSAPKVERWREPTRHADVINISTFYGAAVLRAAFGAEFYTRRK